MQIHKLDTKAFVKLMFCSLLQAEVWKSSYVHTVKARWHDTVQSLTKAILHTRLQLQIITLKVATNPNFVCEDICWNTTQFRACGVRRAVRRSIAFNKPCNRHRQTEVATAALSASVSLPLPDLATTWKDSWENRLSRSVGGWDSCCFQ
jgi:hypothetical protein